jgi:hypothetical protein
MCGRAYETYTDEELYFPYLNKAPNRVAVRIANLQFVSHDELAGFAAG